MKLVQRLRQSTFLRHNLIFFVGSVGVGVLNYLYYPILGRLMEPAAFGEVQALVSLFLQLTIFLNVLGMVTVNVVVNYRDQRQANRVVFELEKLAVLTGLGLLAGTIIFGSVLRDALQFESVVPFTALALALVVSVPLTFRSAYIRARKQFGVASIAQLLGSASKIVLSVALVAVGLSTVGAILGIVAAQIAALIYASLAAAKAGFHKPPDAAYKRRLDVASILPELRYGCAVLGGSLTITMLMSVDILMVKHYFDPHTAGLYAGVATVARIIFFFTASVALVLMSEVKLANSLAKNRALLYKSLVLVGGIGGAALTLCVLAPRFIIGVLMGNEYNQYASLLPLLACAMFIISVLNLLFAYYLALRRVMVTIIGIIGFVVTLGALFVTHDSLRTVVGSVLIGSIVTMCLLVIYAIIKRTPVRTQNER